MSHSTSPQPVGLPNHGCRYRKMGSISTMSPASSNWHGGYRYRSSGGNQTAKSLRASRQATSVAWSIPSRETTLVSAKKVRGSSARRLVETTSMSSLANSQGSTFKKDGRSEEHTSELQSRLPIWIADFYLKK